MTEGVHVTSHCLRHLAGRCKVELPAGRGAAEAVVRGMLAGGRMSTRLEARIVSLWLFRARRWDSPNANALSTADVVADDAADVGFVLALAGPAVTVTTAVRLSAVRRFARGLPGSKYRRLAGEAA